VSIPIPSASAGFLKPNAPVGYHGQKTSHWAPEMYHITPGRTITSTTLRHLRQEDSCERQRLFWAWGAKCDHRIDDLLFVLSSTEMKELHFVSCPRAEITRQSSDWKSSVTVFRALPSKGSCVAGGQKVRGRTSTLMRHRPVNAPASSIQPYDDHSVRASRKRHYTRRNGPPHYWRLGALCSRSLT